ncbi:hypothetical protein DFJ67_5470 [Asanoa ferruginea]|uniref:Ig-like domain-containing protein n=1 Tax=Asanoa ferruginea TaxID=53367 RepID=A0A3D9ZS36_9ACTN|nr:hypothetical protein [Asanoa ferruginea]REF99434.1 hypothetical protein DFJ67_5470 [Asanoa ferruginea]GIF46039.1 hypothetical protein Afe04nite_05780 [Asanoa ferruginea]
MTKHKRARLLVAGAIAVGGALAIAVPAGAAVQLQSESPARGIAKINKTAQIKANGAAGVVTIQVNCVPQRSFDSQVTVSQRVGGQVTSGVTYLYNIRCEADGTNKVKASVVPGPKPFKPGVAFATARVDFYPQSDSASREITFVR